MDSQHSPAPNFIGDVARRSISTAVVSAPPMPRLAATDVVGLCRAMRDATPIVANRASVLCFTGVSNTDAVGSIALESAMGSAQRNNTRVLLIDAMPNPKGERRMLQDALRSTLVEALRSGPAFIGDAFTTLHGSNLAYTCLYAPGHEDHAVMMMDSFFQLVEEFRFSYNLIIINAPPIMKSSLATELAKFADGTILVVEAEKTRAPVAARAKSTIEAAGGKVIGAVLSNRRFPIPSFFYRWL